MPSVLSRIRGLLAPTTPDQPLRLADGSGGGGGGASPLTTKGDLLSYDTAPDRLPVGADGDVLTADSTQAMGVKWDVPSGGGGGGLADVPVSDGATTVNATSIVFSGATVSSLGGSVAGVAVTGGGGGGGVTTHFGSGAPSTLYTTGDLYFDLASGAPLTGYVQTNVSITPSIGTVGVGQASTTSTMSVTVSTPIGANLLVIVTAAEISSGVAAVASVTGAGLTFTKYTSSATSGNATVIEIWTAPLAAPLTGATITVTYGANFDDGTIGAFGVSNFANWDAGSGLPSAIGAVGTLGPITTTVSEDLLLYVASSNTPTDGGTPSGYTQIAQIGNGSGSLYNYTQIAIYAPGAILTGYTLATPSASGATAFLLAALSPAAGGSWQRFA